MHGVQAYLLVLIGCVWEQKVYCNALFWNSQAFSINDSILYLWILYIIILILRISWNPGSKPHSACFSKICFPLLQYFLGQFSEFFCSQQICSIQVKEKVYDDFISDNTRPSGFCSYKYYILFGRQLMWNWMFFTAYQKELNKSNADKAKGYENKHKLSILK